MPAPLFSILSLFPDVLEPYLSAGVLGGALQRGLARVDLYDFRDWSRDRRRTVDDRPFGGGPGMVLKPEPIADCVEWVEERAGPHRRIVLDPTGRRFDQALAAELAAEERTLLLCGRYEGFDQRVLDALEFEPLSIGDFVLSGGELPALCVVEAAVRLLPGALGDERSAVEDSFQEGRDLDHPHWTRPRVWRGWSVPEVLLGGDHERIARWRREQAEQRARRAGRTAEPPADRETRPRIARDPDPEEPARDPETGGGASPRPPLDP